MRIEIGWIICLLFYGTTVGHSADFAPSAHLPCEQLHKARHYLSVGDFARCADELRTVRQACDHRECLEQAELLQRDCESKAMMALLKSPPPATLTPNVALTCPPTMGKRSVDEGIVARPR